MAEIYRLVLMVQTGSRVQTINLQLKFKPYFLFLLADDVSVPWVSLDVVWAKLEGFPWWPSLVCPHPTTANHIKAGKQPQVHVQFFDEPICRAWIKAKYADNYLCL